MKLKIFLNILFLSIVVVTAPVKNVFADTAGSSAALSSNQLTGPIIDNRVAVLQSFLQTYNSPLAPYAATFIEEADRNGLDWRLVPAISGVESYFGQMIPPYSYNGWGYGVYGNNVRRFNSWDEGISTVSKSLREDYMGKWGAVNVYEIGALYAADPSWAYKVTNYMNAIEEFKTQDNSSLSISL